MMKVTDDPSMVRVTDYLTADEQKRLDALCEKYAPVGANDSIVLDGLADVVIAAQKGEPYPDRDNLFDLFVKTVPPVAEEADAALHDIARPVYDRVVQAAEAGQEPARPADPSEQSAKAVLRTLLGMMNKDSDGDWLLYRENTNVLDQAERIAFDDPDSAPGEQSAFLVLGHVEGGIGENLHQFIRAADEDGAAREFERQVVEANRDDWNHYENFPTVYVDQILNMTEAMRENPVLVAEPGRPVDTEEVTVEVEGGMVQDVRLKSGRPFVLDLRDLDVDATMGMDPEEEADETADSTRDPSL